MMCRVAIFEDEYLIQMLWEDIVDSLDYPLAGAWRSVGAGLEGIATNEIDVAILDLNLEGTISHELLAALEAKGIPVIVCTGASDLDLPPAFTRHQTLHKPFKVSEARALLEKNCTAPAA